MGDLDSFEGVLTPNEVKGIIEKRIRTSDYEVLDKKCETTGSNSGYLGQYFRVTIILRINETQETEVLRYFVKKTPLATSPMGKAVADSGVYVKEIAVYTKIFTEFEEITFAPVIYLSKDDLLVFNDLSQDGYQMPNKFAFFTIEQCEVVLRKVAELHAQSFIFEENITADGKKRSIQGTYGEILAETYFRDVEDSSGYKLTEASISAHLYAIDLLDIPQFRKNHLKQVSAKVMRKIYEFMQPSKNYRNVLSHGDLWANNILLKYENGVVSDCQIVDYQLAKCAPPAQDVMSFIHLTTSRLFRKQNEERLIRYYHDQLTNILANRKLDIDVVLPLDIFLESCHYYRPHAVIQEVFWYQTILADEETTSEYLRHFPPPTKSIFEDKTELVTGQWKAHGIYREMLTDTMMAFEEICEKHFPEYRRQSQDIC
ncbi:uncharacterized protein LOC125500097 [Athalia rosae]|uniref:uncharacterized protein LOC125500097 n=1 Tax=Athalia rosae TaxID=37344 RepID=UPI002034199A|nr:uncharacterized protein LOC125500097 [Athalia rosae]